MTSSLGLQGSVSAYYHREMRNVFVGILFAIGIFLLSYNPSSYDQNYEGDPDRQYGICAGVFAIVVALFPAWGVNWESINPPAGYDEKLYGFIHLIFAVLLFVMLFKFSYNLFTKIGPKQEVLPGSKKALRNKIYKANGFNNSCLHGADRPVLFFRQQLARGMAGIF